MTLVATRSKINQKTLGQRYFPSHHDPSKRNFQQLLGLTPLTPQDQPDRTGREQQAGAAAAVPAEEVQV
jgi:hypothetical protein